eukprot:641139_1
METKSNITSHIAMHSYVQPDDDSMSRDTMSNTHTMTRTETVVDLSPTSAQSIAGNPKHWEWKEVKSWLEVSGLHDMVVVFQEGPTQKEGTDGVELLNLDLTKLYEEAGHYKAGVHLNISSIHAAEASPLIQRFFRELTRLKLKANESSNDFTEREATIDDVVEMKRRISLFVEKWDRIIWIDQYLETNAELPTETVVSEELGVSLVMSQVYLNYHQNQEREKKKEVDELILDFNVYNDCVLWWYIIMEILGTAQTKAIWLLFNRVAELTPSNVAFSLLDKYKFDLTRFDAHNLEELAQNIVVGSQYAICAALRMSKFFIDIAEYDVARAAVFENVSESFIDAAFDYLNLIESDHMATVILEVKSDIEAMSAFDMALEYELTKFVTDQRIERITTSIMNNFEFLRPENRDSAFQVEPLSVQLIWRKLRDPAFYFIPLGTYCVEVFLYLSYLALFTYLSVQQFRVYDPMLPQEILFWVFNLGYVVNEGQSLLTEGMASYFSDSQNYFDTVISFVFISSFAIRIYAFITGPDCEGPLHTPSPSPTEDDDHDYSIPCWAEYGINAAFVILWGIATITLWLRLVNFCILSHSLGPMVQMIFSMMGDIKTFFEIMIILFLGFAMALMFILGDALEEFANPGLSSITLFRALLGDFEFENLQEAEVSDTIKYFGFGVMLLYLVIGSLILLNLLIAMMAKTFDTIGEDTTAAIIFARFELAIDRDQKASQMPPPLNVFAMCFLALFYIIEKVTDSCKRICCCCCRLFCKKEHINFDLAVLLMPPFMKDRKLELDDQILWSNCHMYCTIVTNRGPTKCKVVKYKPEIGDHYVRFYNDEEKPIKVSVQNSVEKKHHWQVDLFDLNDDELIDFEQFDDVDVDAEWTHTAHRAMKEDKKNGQTSSYWICAFCKGYVKASKLSIKRLGYMLNVSELEMKIVLKVRPDICPNCYRVRLERQRWELAWEIVSLWMYYIVVAPFLMGIFFVIIAFRVVKDPSELGRTVDMLKSKLSAMKKETQQVIEEIADDGDEKEQKEENKYNTDKRYVGYHYKDTQLISNMNELVEKDSLFDIAVRNDIWELLDSAKNDIDAFLLLQKIKNHVMALSEEDELTEGEFFDGFIDVDGLKRNGGDFLWNEYFKPLASTIFERIQLLRNDWVPLHLFRRYPFDVQLVLDDFTGFFDEIENFDTPLRELEVEDIADALGALKSLNCINREQREKIVRVIESVTDNIWSGGGHDDTLFDKFVRYMAEVQALFQDTRTIKNLLRDVSTAIVERGADCTVFQDQIHFLFEDIRNVTLAIPFFNSMRTEKKDGDLKVELWTIRNTLYALYFLNNIVRKYILEQNSRIHVVRQQLLDMVYRSYVNDIIDPEGITDIIFTEEMEREITEKSLYEEEVADTHKPTPSFTLAQKSTIGFQAALQLDPDAQNEADRQVIVKERMELFHKDAITASAIKDEVSSIFDKIQQRRTMKITESSIAYYRRNGLRSVRLLQDDETLRYIFEQLSRFATFYPENVKEECSMDVFRTILVHQKKFGSMYRIDEQTIPKKVKNNRYIEQLYGHLLDIYNDTSENKFNSIIAEKTKSYMSVEDVMSIVMLYERTFSTLNMKTVDSGDMFTCDHDVFVKFVDAKGFTPGSPMKDWTHKTRATSDLFQSVLDDAQKVVTLGQVRQTIDKLMRDIGGMKCGELTRIMNHLRHQYTDDNNRCEAKRKTYLRVVGQQDAATQLRTQQSMLSQRSRRINSTDKDKFDINAIQENAEDPSSPIAKKETMMNPGLEFKHILRHKWIHFIDELAAGFEMNVKSSKIKHILAHKRGHSDHEEEAKFDDSGGKEIIDSILENTKFDIIRVPQSHGFSEDVDEDEKAEMKEESRKKESRRKQVVKKKRAEVFDTMLSFCNARVTLQQLFSFSNMFKDFFTENGVVNAMMQQYDLMVKHSASLNTLSEEQKLRRVRIPQTIEEFKEVYFEGTLAPHPETGKPDNTWDAEITWLFLGTENKYDLCHKIYPFWSGSIISDIYSFMESTEQIQGNYELKEAEFSQLKHQLNVNDELATKLFHIIRFKLRSLSWKQIYSYFKFLLLMKYNVHKAILTSKQAEDTTLSLDAIKLELEIKLNDESKWLFSKTDSYHGSKVTWKQISKYLKKMVKVRDEMRDFFRDNARDREFEKNKSEIINTIYDNVENNVAQNESLEEKLLKELQQLSHRMRSIERKMDSIRFDPNIAKVPSKIHTKKNLSLASHGSIKNLKQERLNTPPVTRHKFNIDLASGSSGSSENGSGTDDDDKKEGSIRINDTGTPPVPQQRDALITPFVSDRITTYDDLKLASRHQAEITPFVVVNSNSAPPPQTDDADADAAVADDDDDDEQYKE